MNSMTTHQVVIKTHRHKKLSSGHYLNSGYEWHFQSFLGRMISLMFKILYPLDKNQCQAVSGKCSQLKDIQISAEADFDSIY